MQPVATAHPASATIKTGNAGIPLSPVLGETVVVVAVAAFLAAAETRRRIATGSIYDASVDVNCHGTAAIRVTSNACIPCCSGRDQCASTTFLSIDVQRRATADPKWEKELD